MGRLDGKVAIVTGSARGLGAAVARLLAREGAAVTLTDLLTEGIEENAARIEAAGGQALAITSDISAQNDVEAVVAETVRKFGGIDILVNNAQAIPTARPLEDYTEELMLATYRAGPLGAWFYMVACLPHMRAKGRGKIVNFTSAAAYTGIAQQGAYAVAKEGMRGLTVVGAREWGKYGITVNGIAPAAMTDGLREYADTHPELIAAAMDHLSIKRFGDPDRDIAPAVLFLCSSDSDYVTGCTVTADGGGYFVM